MAAVRFRRLALFASAFLSASPLAAEVKPEPIAVEIAGNVDCVSADEFFVRIATYTSKVTRAPSGSPARRFVVSVSTPDDQTRGDLTIVDADGSEAKRTVQGKDCAAVISVLALIAAIAVDPEAITREVPDQSPKASRPRPTVERSTPPAPPAKAGAASSRSDESRAKHFSAGPAAFTTLVPGTPRFVGVGLVASAESTSTAFLTPSLDLALFRATSETVSTPNGSARFVWWLARFTTCPIVWPTPRWRLTPCALLDAGALTGEGFRTRNATTKTRFWTAAGAALRGEIRPIPEIMVAVDLAGYAPLARYEFYFGPDETAFAMPAFGASLSGYLRAAIF